MSFSSLFSLSAASRPTGRRLFVLLLSIIYLYSSPLFAKTDALCVDIVTIARHKKPLLEKIADKELAVERLKFILETKHKEFTLSLYLGHENIGYIIGNPVISPTGTSYIESHVRIHETRFFGKRLGTLLYYAGAWAAQRVNSELVSSSRPSPDAQRLWEKHKFYGLSTEVVTIKEKLPTSSLKLGIKRDPIWNERPIFNFDDLLSLEPELIEFLNRQVQVQGTNIKNNTWSQIYSDK